MLPHYKLWFQARRECMSGYSIISLFSLFCYLLMFTTFLAARKSQRIVRSFLALLGFMIVWNLGSLFMRTEQYPSPYFWHQISLLGLFLFPVGYYQFFGDFVGVYDHGRRLFWRIVFLLLYAVNLFTGMFVPLPKIEISGLQTTFSYHYTNAIYFVFFVILLLVVDIVFMTRKRKDRQEMKKSLMPLVYGIVALLVGHFLTTIPLFVGIPVDIISGIINAFFFIYALYQKRIFKVTMLLSKENIYLISFLLCIMLLFNLAWRLQEWMTSAMHLSINEILVFVGIGTIGVTIVLYLMLKSFLQNFFLQDEQIQNDALTTYTSKVTQLLDAYEIFETLNVLVKSTLKNWNIIAFNQGTKKGGYDIAYSSNPLDSMEFHLDLNHPLANYLKESKSISKWEDFQKSNYYRSVWEGEKSFFETMKAQYVAPFMIKDNLIGILILSSQGKKGHKASDIGFIHSVLAVTSIALNNAQKYEHAYMEARMDELTGVYNRKYFHELLEKKYEQYKHTSLALAIANIDDFRLYNQMYGQKQGDALLCSLAQLFQTSVMNYGYVARIGEKEFGIILPEYDILSAKTMMENLLEKVQNKQTGFPFIGHATFSAGVCASPYLASSAHELFSNTEMAVSGVKRSGKNGVQMYSEEVRNRLTSRYEHHSKYDLYASTIYALTAAIDAKDHYTFSHSQNVAYYAKEIALAMGLSEELVNIVYEAGLLHDIGKISIPEDILNKSGRLTNDEYDIMKQHVMNAVDIIRHLPAMEYVVPAVISHHERFDGNGYPRQLRGEDIPLLGRILCVADSFDAMISRRSYKKEIAVNEALLILEEQAGKQFDPKCVDAFVPLIQKNKIEIRKDQFQRGEIGQAFKI